MDDSNDRACQVRRVFVPQTKAAILHHLRDVWVVPSSNLLSLYSLPSKVSLPTRNISVCRHSIQTSHPSGVL
jgi:hypothetical protein